MDNPHPEQTIVKAEDGKVRFRQNKIVRKFLDVAREGKTYDMNDVRRDHAEGFYSDEDLVQFYQLIGYSVDGFGEVFLGDFPELVHKYDQVADHIGSRSVGNPYQSFKPEADDPRLFYVQDSRSYVGNSILWWAPDRNGYTTHIDRAGKYTAKEVRGMRATDIPWPVNEVDEIWSSHVDQQHLHQTKTAVDRRERLKRAEEEAP